MNEESLAELLEAVLAHRAEPCSDCAPAAIGASTRAERDALRLVIEAVAALAFAEAPVAPPPHLRERVLVSARERQRSGPCN
jgi:hypothetical protein